MVSIRPAVPGDAPEIIAMIHEFAEFEHLSATVTEESLLRDCFGPEPKIRALIAEVDGQPAGYAIFLGCYSTFLGQPGLFLEDIFIRPDFRRAKAGEAFFQRLAAIALEEKCYGLVFNVLHWNQPAINFYLKHGGEFLDDWKVVNLRAPSLRKLADRVDSSD